MADPLYVPRPDVAARIAGLLNPDPLLGDMSGLFLAAPRRTGKSTFLRGDLVPRLEAEGKLVLYVDLWSSTKTDPGQLITGCIAGGLERSDGLIAKFRRNVPFSSVGALGFRVDLKASGSWEGTIPDALTLLVQATGKDVVMIVDEAQHSLVSEDGKSAMFALKAARDAVNQNNLPGHLYLIMTGSHRDKLAALVQDQQAPFYGASVRDFPTLGPEYTRALTEHLNKRLSANARLNPEVVEEAFETLGRRPERLTSCLRDLLVGTVFGEEELRRLVQADCAAAEANLLSEIGLLSPIQRRLLRIMAVEGIDFAPFTEATKMALEEAGCPNSKGAIQKALDALREKGLVWRPSFGRYVLENSEIAQALRKR